MFKRHEWIRGFANTVNCQSGFASEQTGIKPDHRTPPQDSCPEAREAPKRIKCSTEFGPISTAAVRPADPVGCASRPVAMGGSQSAQIGHSRTLAEDLQKRGRLGISTRKRVRSGFESYRVVRRTRSVCVISCQDFARGFIDSKRSRSDRDAREDNRASDPKDRQRCENGRRALTVKSLDCLVRSSRTSPLWASVSVSIACYRANGATALNLHNTPPVRVG